MLGVSMAFVRIRNPNVVFAPSKGKFFLAIRQCHNLLNACRGIRRVDSKADFLHLLEMRVA